MKSICPHGNKYAVLYNNRLIGLFSDEPSARAALVAAEANDAPIIPPTSETPDYRNIKWIPRLNRWQVRLSHGGKQVLIGTYRSQAQAIEGYTDQVGAPPVLVQPVETPTAETPRIKGIVWSDTLKRWVVKAKVNGRPYKVGRFRTQAEAIKALERTKELLTPYTFPKDEAELPKIEDLL